jgi:hypothetical protein
MVQACPHQWSSWLSLAEFWYNTTYHSDLCVSPFEAMYGYRSKHFGLHHSHVPMGNELKDWVEKRSKMTQVIQDNLHCAQQRMKHQADKHRLEREFMVGDWVYLKLQPYIQRFVAIQASQKLSYKYFGPYLIKQKVGKVAYKLQLPDHSPIHLVVHVSQLKKALPPTSLVSSDESLLSIRTDAVLVPKKIRDTKLRQVGASASPVMLVQ